MAFFRRKSGAYQEDVHQEDVEYVSRETTEPQRRRRLSKPLTNSSSTSLATSAAQNVTRRKSMNRVSHEDSTTPSPNESRETLRTLLFSPSSDLDLTMPKPKSKPSKVALMTLKFESKSAQASRSPLLPPSPALPQRPASHMSDIRRTVDDPKLISSASDDRLGDVDLATLSPGSTEESLIQNPAPPPRRTASFIPGMATRKPSKPHSVVDEETESAVAQAEAVTIQKYVKKYLYVDGEEDAKSPERQPRSATPSDLEYPSIGRLGLGSLRVVNGAISPAPSESSRRGRPLWLPMERRDTSSVYPESEIGTVKSRKTIQSEWEDEPLPPFALDAAKHGLDVHRAFSFKPGSEMRFNNNEPVSRTLDQSSDEAEIRDSGDRTERMADDYREGLPTSPFTAPASPSPSCCPDSDALQTTPSVQRACVEGTSVAQSSPLSHKTASSPTSQSSVRRFTEKANSRRSFVDETLGSSPSPERPVSQISSRTPDRPGSPTSFFSVLESDNEVEDRFKSAVELQPSRSRSRSPRKPPQKSTVKAAQPALQSLPERSNTKSDSGYSSNTSLSTVLPPLDWIHRENELAPHKEEKRGFRLPFRKTAQKTGKPVLVRPASSVEVPLPESAQIESISAVTSTTSIAVNTEISNHDSSQASEAINQKPREKQRKKLQKPRRKSTVEIAGELVIQRLASVECFDVPLISSSARDGLAQRSKAIPELEATYRTTHHTTEKANASTLTLPMQDVSFPSPANADDQRKGRLGSGSRTRRRSLSRPRTWFGWSKDDKEMHKCQNGKGENIDLNELTSVIDMLGDNPYDMAQKKSRGAMPPSAWNNRPDTTWRQTTPSNITTNAPRPKSTMDDQMASNVSKMRRQWQTDPDDLPAARPFFDDRGGVPGKMPHSARLSTDAPPLPPMPSTDEINRRLSYRGGYATHPSPVAYETHENSELVSFEGHSEAPPPPPHSPEPNFINEPRIDTCSAVELEIAPAHQQYPMFEDDLNYVEDEEPALPPSSSPPPPPCHSPRPMDITHEQERSGVISWSSQASAWKERRKSASAALRQSWRQEQQYHEQSPPQEVSHHHDSNVDQQWRDGDYQTEDYVWHQDNPYDNHSARDHVRSRQHYHQYDDLAQQRFDGLEEQFVSSSRNPKRYLSNDGYYYQPYRPQNDWQQNNMDFSQRSQSSHDYPGNYFAQENHYRPHSAQWAPYVR